MGKPLNCRKPPVRSTNANGITDYKTYEVVYVLPSETSRLPKVSASSDNKDVKVEVKQARPDAETAVVTFDYQGLAKTYNVVFSRSFVVMGINKVFVSGYRFRFLKCKN